MCSKSLNDLSPWLAPDINLCLAISRVRSQRKLLLDMLAVMSAMTAQCSPSSSSAHKRPRGLWKGRRDATPARDPKTALLSHDIDSDLEDEHRANDSVYDDDLEDNRSSTSSSSKRRRLTGAFSDIGSPWPSTGRITRSLTPEMFYVPSPPHTLTTMLKPSPSSATNDSKGKLPSISDYEDWENLKELFARAAELCECAYPVYIPAPHLIAINISCAYFFRSPSCPLPLVTHSR